MSTRRILDVIAYVEAQDEITSNEAFVLHGIANYTNLKGYAYPSLKTLQRYTRLAIRTIRDTLRKLEARGALHTIREPGRHSLTFQLLIPHVSRSKCTPAPHAGVLNALRHHMPPYPVFKTKERKNARAKEKTDTRDDTPPRTWDPADLAAKARKVGITPGSILWNDMTATATDGLYEEVLRNIAMGAPIPWVPAQFGRGRAVWLVMGKDGQYLGERPR
jgi:hypothetical protein